jgi:hypothetical protein
VSMFRLRNGAPELPLLQTDLIFGAQGVVRAAGLEPATF